MKKDTATYDDFQKLDIRAGLVLSAEMVPDSKKLIELRVELGEEYGQVTILTALGLEFGPEAFAGRTFAFIANLAPRPMAGRVSQGMIMAGDATTGPVLLPLPEGLAPGSLVR